MSKQQGISVQDYFHLTDRYLLPLEYMDGQVMTRTGTPVVVLGGVPPEEQAQESAEKALILICEATQQEIEQIAALLHDLRS
jgi:hypothetical protein